MAASLGAGLRAALPIMIGYFPVAVAFGTAGRALGLDPWLVTLLSVLVYSGASQFLILSTLGGGTPLPLVVALCAGLNLRHLLYGLILMSRLPPLAALRFLYAFTLTDEVFASTLARAQDREEPFAAPWLLGLGLGAYGAWVAGTATGAYLGDALAAHVPLAAEASRFALPALFLAIAWANLSAATLRPMLAALVVALPLGLMGQSAWGILGGALAGVLVAAWGGRR
ncbi:AzlC family ABC transporter permease [Pararhodospirillum photometricum]|uniref:AzlC-like n=1 Tax=Pararhodospirillum photometricum DSM 122 TaxID=1150469 RepID=H6SLG0_PARPM|nr:AzlC family ABC transporter permease [Pararhodospirillum photometricum]CCG08825.1 AzlC-like [Pararhodospirillum photometricum DSM 122]